MDFCEGINSTEDMGKKGKMAKVLVPETGI